ncbi:MAG: hypothetical protein ACR2H5_07330 [Ktedonobacteraceae bacterium]
MPTAARLHVGGVGIHVVQTEAGEGYEVHAIITALELVGCGEGAAGVEREEFVGRDIRLGQQEGVERIRAEACHFRHVSACFEAAQAVRAEGRHDTRWVEASYEF